MRTNFMLLALLGLICLSSILPTNAVQVASKLQMRQQNNGDQCEVNGQTTNVDDEINGYGQDLPTNRWDDDDDDDDDIYDDAEDILEDRIERLVLQNRDGWNATNDDYNTLVDDLRSLLKINQADFQDDIRINPNDVNPATVDCEIVGNNANIPNDQQDCADLFREVQPHLANFARQAQQDNGYHALFWLLKALDNMPELANACTGQGFRIPRHDSDDDDCEDEIESTANLLINIANNNDLLFGDANRLNTLIQRRVPRTIAYCFGTD